MFTVDFKLDSARITLESGALAGRALGAVVARHQRSVVLASVVATPRDEASDFLHLTVDYRERSAAVGRIPGGFGKREGRPGEREILTSRLIDRAMRARMPQDLLAEIHLQIIVLSADRGTDLEGLALIAAGAALSLSGLPFGGPVVGLRMSAGGGKLHTFVSATKAAQHDHQLIAAYGPEGLLMLEGGGAPTSELELMLLLNRGAAAVEPAFEAIEQLKAMAGRQGDWARAGGVTEADLDPLRQQHGAQIEAALMGESALARSQALQAMRRDLGEGAPSGRLWRALIKDTLRAMIQRGIRPEGRALDGLREISAQIGMLPACHGDGLFTRGETQVLATATLGGPREGLQKDGVQHQGHSPFFLHYNFPDFAVGEARSQRGSPGRREIGHGALAARALQPLLPSSDTFPFTVRVVADVLSANGSSSMASVCAGSLALMDAGVPLRAPVAGVSVGLVGGVEGALLLDLLGEEDGAGEMDLKIAGPADGITALQMDHHLPGLPIDRFMEALELARQGRLQILEAMSGAIDAARDRTKPQAPAYGRVQIAEGQPTLLSDRNRLDNLQGQTKSQITAYPGGAWITAKDHDGLAAAMAGLVPPPALEVGQIYQAEVISLRPFGAIVKLEEREGLVHISELADPQPGEAGEIVQVGDPCPVKVIGVDGKGRPRLSRKAALADEAG